MLYRSKCDLCRECLAKCQYVDYSEEKAKEESKRGGIRTNSPN